MALMLSGVGGGVASFAAFGPPGIGLSAAAPVFLQAARPQHYPTTTQKFSGAVPIAAPEALPDLAPVPAIEAAEESLPTTQPPTLTPESWMDLFATRNNTHVTIPHLNQTLSIAGKNETVRTLTPFYGRKMSL